MKIIFLIKYIFYYVIVNNKYNFKYNSIKNYFN